MSVVESFTAASGQHPRVLILGSIPGVASLQAQQYYAHPRNAFWSIMAQYFQFDRQASYPQRLHWLQANGVALWDVLQRCERPGSLDSDIVTSSIRVNPIDQWLQGQPSVQLILLNGGAAGREFKKHFAGIVQRSSVRVLVLPSTSPAYAAMPVATKIEQWHAALDTVRFVD